MNSFGSTGVYRIEFKKGDAEFLKDMTCVVFHCLNFYENYFGLYFPLRRKDVGRKVKQIYYLDSIKPSELVGATSTFLSYKGSNPEPPYKKCSQKIGKLEIYLLGPGQSIPPEYSGTGTCVNWGIPSSKPGRIEVVLPFGMVRDKIFYENIISLKQVKEDKSFAIIGVVPEIANNFLKYKTVCVEVEGHKRDFVPKPSLLLTRGRTPSGKNWGKSSVFVNWIDDATQLFGVISVDPGAVNSREFLNWVDKVAIVPWKGYEEKRNNDLSYHSVKSM